MKVTKVMRASHGKMRVSRGGEIGGLGNFNVHYNAHKLLTFCTYCRN